MWRSICTKEAAFSLRNVERLYYYDYYYDYYYYTIYYISIYIYNTLEYISCLVSLIHKIGTCAAAGLSLESRTREGFVSCVARVDVFCLSHR